MDTVATTASPGPRTPRRSAVIPTVRIRALSRPGWSRTVALICTGSAVSLGSLAMVGASAAGANGHPTSVAAAAKGRTEHFRIGSSKPTGPGTIIVTGVVNAGGLERPGPAVDSAVFTGGGFRVDHSVGHPTVRFNPRTCVGTITQSGPFRIFDGTGRFSHLQGSGRYRFRADYTTSRNRSGCTQTMTAYIETIDGMITVDHARS